MLLFLMIKKPFTENALNCANIVTELGLCLIFPIISIFLFDISSKTRERIDIFLIILVNAIISSQMLASLYTTSQILIQKIRSRKSAQINPDITIEQNKKMNVFITPADNDKRDFFDNLGLNKINVSAEQSCELSRLSEEEIKPTLKKKKGKL